MITLLNFTIHFVFQEPNHQEESSCGERDAETNGDKRGVSSSLSSLIKVSPLKSLLREDLRRRISARGRARGSNVCPTHSVMRNHSPTLRERVDIEISRGPGYPYYRFYKPLSGISLLQNKITR